MPASGASPLHGPRFDEPSPRPRARCRAAPTLPIPRGTAVLTLRSATREPWNAHGHAAASNGVAFVELSRPRAGSRCGCGPKCHAIVLQDREDSARCHGELRAPRPLRNQPVFRHRPGNRTFRDRGRLHSRATGRASGGPCPARGLSGDGGARYAIGPGDLSFGRHTPSRSFREIPRELRSSPMCERRDPVRDRAA